MEETLDWMMSGEDVSAKQDLVTKQCQLFAFTELKLGGIGTRPTNKVQGISPEEISFRRSNEHFEVS